MTTHRTRNLALLTLAIAAVLIAFFAVTDIPPSEDDVAGTMANADTTTIAGVESAARYRTNQIEDADVILGDPTFQRLLQDNDFIKFVQSGDMAMIIAIDDLSKTMDLEKIEAMEKAGELSKIEEMAKTGDLEKAIVFA
ncbi:MAG: hypothetical protein HKN17_02985, partial [Rhodothermales bacterium]|nr:hypothetical protein [Rhodothermales bacterium]